MHAFCRSRPKNLPTGNGRNVSWNHAAQEQDIWRDLTASGSNSNLSQMQLSKLVYGKCDFTDVHIRYQYTCAERGCTVHTTHGRSTLRTDIAILCCQSTVAQIVGDFNFNLMFNESSFFRLLLIF